MNQLENEYVISKRLILKNSQSPGDVVMLTAAVRDLHECDSRSDESLPELESSRLNRAREVGESEKGAGGGLKRLPGLWVHCLRSQKRSTPRRWS